MSVGKICNRSVVVVAPDDSVREAARRMAQYNVGTLVVLDADERLLGILSDRDVALRCIGSNLDPDADSVGDVMTSPVRSVPESTPIEDALSTMAASGVRRLPVVDAEDHLVGILSLDDVLELLAEEAEAIGRLLRKYGPDIPSE